MPLVGQFAADFGVQPAALQGHRLKVEAVCAVGQALAAVDGSVFLVNLEERDARVQVAVVPFAFPAHFIVVAQGCGQRSAVFAGVGVVFEDAGVAGVEAVVGVKVVGDAEVRHEAAFFGALLANGAGVGFAVAQVVVPAPVAFPVAVAGAGEDVQVVGGVHAHAAGNGVGGVVVAAVVAAVRVVPVGAGDFVAGLPVTPGAPMVVLMPSSSICSIKKPRDW